MNVMGPIESYDYYEWGGVGPLGGALNKGINLLLPEWGGKLMLLLFMAVGLIYFTWRLPPKRRWFLAMILPIFIFEAYHSLVLIWVLPLYLFCLALLDSRPLLVGFISTFGTLVGLHPLISILLIFFTKERKAYGIGAGVGALIGFLIPLIVYEPILYFQTIAKWYVGFRTDMPPLANGSVSDYSLIGLLRYYTDLHPRIIWLILVNLFHFLLLPTLRIGRSRNPYDKAHIFVGSVLTFIGLMSGLNSPYTIILPLSGILLWAHYSKLYPQWVTFVSMIIVCLLSYSMTFAIWLSPQIVQTHTVLLCMLTIFSLLPIHLLQVIELWYRPRQRKRKR